MRLQDLLTDQTVAAETKAGKDLIEKPIAKIERGQLFIHASRQTKVTVVEAYVQDEGDPVHVVIESGTGREFRALERNLKTPR